MEFPTALLNQVMKTCKEGGYTISHGNLTVIAVKTLSVCASLSYCYDDKSKKASLLGPRNGHVPF